MNVHPTLSRPPHRLVFPVALLLLAATTTATIVATAADDATHGLRIVIMRVMVTLDDAPRTGLTRDDFRLTLDGEEVPITTWEEITPDHRAATLRGLVFVDEAFALPGMRNRALLELRRALAGLPPEDQGTVTMAVAAFDGERVELLAPWTSAKGLLTAALDAATHRPAFGLLRESERLRQSSLTRRRSHLADAGSFSGTGFLGATRSTWEEPEGKADLLRHRAHRSASAAARTLEALADDRGGALLLLGGGWLSPSGDQGGEALSPSAPAAECETLAEPLLQAAGRLGFAIYPVDLASDPAATDGSPTIDSLSLRLADISGGRFAISSATASSATGPSAALAFHHALTDAQHHYRLGFLVPEGEAGANREPRVELARPTVPEHTGVRIVVLPRTVLPRAMSGDGRDAENALFPLILQEERGISRQNP